MDKIFFWDLGIRNAIIDNFKFPDQRDDVGKLWENFIIGERLKFLSNNQERRRSFFWRTYTGAELDYVEESADRLNGYEIKWSKARNKVPPSWQSAYPDAAFSLVNRENYFDFISVPGK